MQSIPPVHSNQSVISSRTNVGFIPATGLAPRGLAGCSAVVPWQATAPLFQSPRGEPFGPSATRAAHYALCRLLPFVQLGSRLAQLAWDNSLAPTARQISRGKTQNVPRVDAEFIKHTPTGKMEDFAVTCQLVPGVPHLRFGSCTSPRAFGSGFLQTPPHGDSPCPSPSLRLLLYLASGLSPDKFCAMPGTHVHSDPRALLLRASGSTVLLVAIHQPPHDHGERCSKERGGNDGARASNVEKLPDRSVEQQ